MLSVRRGFLISFEPVASSPEKHPRCRCNPQMAPFAQSRDDTRTDLKAGSGEGARQRSWPGLPHPAQPVLNRCCSDCPRRRGALLLRVISRPFCISATIASTGPSRLFSTIAAWVTRRTLSKVR